MEYDLISVYPIQYVLHICGLSALEIESILNATTITQRPTE